MSMIADAHRIRAAEPYTPAAQALARARWINTAPKMDDGDTWEQDGFTLALSVTPDDDPIDDDDQAPTFTNTSSAETIRNPSADGDTRRPGSGMAYAETPSYPRTERISWYRSQGASRSVAIERAEADMRAELDRWTWDYGVTQYVVTVTASRAGVTLGSSSLGSVDLGDDYGDAARYVADVATDLTSDAIKVAQDAVRAICR